MTPPYAGPGDGNNGSPEDNDKEDDSADDGDGNDQSDGY